MGVEIQPGLSSRVRAVLERNPNLTPTEVARELDVRAADVKSVLKRNPMLHKKRRYGAAKDA